MLKIALVSVGHTYALGPRNIRQYCATEPGLAGRVEFRVFDYDIDAFHRSKHESLKHLSFSSAADDVLLDLQRFAPQVVAFSCYLWNTDVHLDLVHLLKRVLPETLTLIGGPDVGPRGVALLGQHPDLDFVINGDGEVPFAAFLAARLGDAPPDYSRVPNLIYRLDGEIRSSPKVETTIDLTRLDGVWASPPAPHELSSWRCQAILYETQRGCPYPCSYCLYGKTNLAQRAVSTVIAEVRGLLDQGLSVFLVDPTLTTLKGRAKEIFRGLARTAPTGMVIFEAYPDSIDEEMADLFAAAAPCFAMLGFQTISESGLAAVGRPKNLAKFERAARLLVERRVPFHVDVIYGLPKTTVQDYLDSVDYLFSFGIERIQSYRLLGLPGSPMLDDAATERLTFSAKPPYEMLSSATFTLSEIVHCSRFAETYRIVRDRIGHANLSRFVRLAGGKLSTVISALMDVDVSGTQDSSALSRALAERFLDLGAEPTPTGPVPEASPTWTAAGTVS